VNNLAIKHLEKFGQNKSDTFIKDMKNLLDTKIAKSTERGGVISKKSMSNLMIILITTIPNSLLRESTKIL
jgi:hypothetical protein